MKKLPLFAVSAALFTTFHPLAAQDHGHVNAGASGGQLIIDNYDDFAGHEIELTYVPLDYVYPGTGTNLAKYAGFYQVGLTFTALSTTDSVNAALPGSYLYLQLVSVEGPDGGRFAFWENTAAIGSPTFSLTADSTGGTDAWRLSENGGAPGSDPYGHVHGRRFTVTEPGAYTVGFQVVDLSTNGPGGTPNYGSPSQVYYFTFTAVPEPTAGLLAGLGAGWLFLRRRSRK